MTKDSDIDLLVVEPAPANTRARSWGVIREIVGFHLPAGSRKYLKAGLARYQIEFPGTHDIKRLLNLVSGDLLILKYLTPTKASTPVRWQRFKIRAELSS